MTVKAHVIRIYMDGCGHRLENLGCGFLVSEEIDSCPICRDYLRDKLTDWKNERRLTGKDPHEGKCASAIIT